MNDIQSKMDDYDEEIDKQLSDDKVRLCSQDLLFDDACGDTSTGETLADTSFSTGPKDAGGGGDSISAASAGTSATAGATRINNVQAQAANVDDKTLKAR